MRQDQEEKQRIETGTGAVKSMCEKQQQKQQQNPCNKYVYKSRWQNTWFYQRTGIHKIESNGNLRTEAYNN